MSDPSDVRITLAYEAATDVLQSQDVTLGNVRTRAGTVLTVAALLTSFAAGLGLINVDSRNGAVFPATGAWTLLGVLVAIAGTSLHRWAAARRPGSALRPRPGEDRRTPERRQDRGVEIRESEVTAMTTDIASNARHIAGRQTAFRCSVVLLVVEVVVLVVFLTLAT